jgi:hypothetical protein
MTELPPFHLAFPVRDVEEARRFYGDLLGCEEGRSDTDWVDFNFFGHQVVAHRATDTAAGEASASPPHHNPVDGHQVPVPHFGVVLGWDQWHRLRDRLLQAEIAFVIEPHIRFAGEAGEQATMFLLDPSGNALEFKAFRDPEQLFAR